ncbi:MAG: hypothetical protein H8E26_07055 [FCB group bacterium]|nr:hypothetical protein [FCB group bacterium]MBL7027140.1 hypothetical protein [Candidatus Neomarinimicrobiota bacterium]MBL7120625.1 hypothetical protein [Candidatus Neomarinimicrobiota bacterium]
MSTSIVIVAVHTDVGIVYINDIIGDLVIFNNQAGIRIPAWIWFTS